MGLGPQVDVLLNSLLPQAKVWDEQSGFMGKIVAEIGASQVSKATSIVRNRGGEIIPGLGVSEDYPLFSDALNAYEQVSREFGSLCRQGQEMMEKIADALIVAHRNYEVNEQSIEQDIQSLIQSFDNVP